MPVSPISEKKNSYTHTISMPKEHASKLKVGSDAEFHIKGNDYNALNWEFMVSLAASDYIEIYWATDDTDVNLHTEVASTPHPGIPSASIDVTFVSNV